MMVMCKNNESEDYDVYEVFDVSYDRSGYPRFLIYKDGQWLRMSAKHFVPYMKEKLSKLVMNADGSMEAIAKEIVVS